jgi:hypothetical protein
MQWLVSSCFCRDELKLYCGHHITIYLSIATNGFFTTLFCTLRGVEPSAFLEILLVILLRRPKREGTSALSCYASLILFLLRSKSCPCNFFLFCRMIINACSILCSSVTSLSIHCERIDAVEERVQESFKGAFLGVIQHNDGFCMLCSTVSYFIFGKNTKVKNYVIQTFINF